MSSSTQSHVDLVLRDAVNEHRQALHSQLQAIYSTHSMTGRLHSGATVKAAIGAMDEIACTAVKSVSARVLEITRDKDAFATLQAAISDLIEFFRDELSTVIRMASGRMPCEPNPSIEQAALELFETMESKVENKIEIAKFHFSGDPSSQAPNADKVQSSKTGRPRSAFWDDMWASIARDLYEGDLKPQTQAAVEEAMLEWIEGHGHSAAVSSVRARARRLWDLISED